MLLLLISVLAFADGAKVVEEGYHSKKEISVGAAVTAYDLLESSVQLMRRPRSGVIGLEVGGVDFTLFAGYWSNEKKNQRFGWHVYLGLGVVWPFADHRKLGLGLDFYPYPVAKNEPGRKRVASFGLDFNVRNDAVTIFTFNDWRHFNVRLAYQVWFSK